MQIDGRTFLIAGGSSGLGAASARRLAARGASVVIADIDPTGRGLAEALGDRAAFASMDVTDEASVAEAVAMAVDRFGGLHGAAVCAGVLGTEKVLGREGLVSPSNFRRVIEINLVGTFNVIRAAAEAIRRHEPAEGGERGVIVTTSSIAAEDGQVGQAAYAASKGGVAALTLPIARELARHGIRIVTIAPGIFETPMMAALPAEARQALAALVPFPPRFGDPDEFAVLVGQIIENPMLNGTTLRRMAP